MKFFYLTVCLILVFVALSHSYPYSGGDDDDDDDDDEYENYRPIPQPKARYGRNGGRNEARNEARSGTRIGARSGARSVARSEYSSGYGSGDRSGYGSGYGSGDRSGYGSGDRSRDRIGARSGGRYVSRPRTPSAPRQGLRNYADAGVLADLADAVPIPKKSTLISRFIELFKELSKLNEWIKKETRDDSKALAIPEKVDRVVSSIDGVIDKSGGLIKDLEALGIKAKSKIGTYDWNSLNLISGRPSGDLPLVPQGGEEPGVFSKAMTGLKNTFSKPTSYSFG